MIQLTHYSFSAQQAKPHLKGFSEWHGDTHFSSLPVDISGLSVA
jgi:hypothetical protein